MFNDDDETREAVREERSLQRTIKRMRDEAARRVLQESGDVDALLGSDFPRNTPDDDVDDLLNS